MGNILVLGANGFIASHLINELLKTHHVVGYDVCESAQFKNHTRYQCMIGDYCTEDRFDEILKKHHISAVYHLICTTVPKEGTERSKTEILQNVLPTLNLLEAMVKAGVKRIIFSSSGGTIYGEGNADCPNTEEDPLHPVCSYGVQKATIEAYLHLYKHMHGISPVIARIGNPYGPWLQQDRTQGIIPILIRKLIAREKIELYGDTIRDYLYIDDAVRALVGMLDYRGNETVFNVGSGDGVWLHDLMTIIERVVGISFDSVNKQTIRSCDVNVNILNSTRLRRELNWYPQVSLIEGIQKTYDAMCKS